MNDRGRAWRERAVRDAVLAGDAVAWRGWYDDHAPGLAAYVAWRCAGLPDLAEDVLQETWLTAVRRLRRFDPAVGPFAAWLAGIASNAVRNALRTQRRKPTRPLAAVPEPGTDPAAADAAGRVAAALAALPAHYEAVLRAKYLDRRTVDEIAADLGVSQKGVESMLGRARQAFREAFEADHD
jgi:RNA polymerase sigma-70 factor (ECF subfamily)